MISMDTSVNKFFSVSQIEEALVQRKKMELLQKYVSDDLQAEESEAKEMIGLWE